MASSSEEIVPTIPGYRMEKKLAQGGMGVVYAAVDDQLGRKVAIKMIRPDTSGSSTDDDPRVTVQRFLNEAKAAAQIRSSHVASVLQFGQCPTGELYLVMELLEGKTLNELLKKERKVSATRAVRIGRQIAKGLAAAHALGIVHRDLKPANVMLVEQDGDPEFVKILDFGVAKKVGDPESDVTRTGSLVGTHTSMAPEQITNGKIDGRTDIYALGVLLFRLVTGRAPFSGDDFVAILHGHLHVQAPRPSSINEDVPPGLDAIVLRCLEKEAARRLQTMGEVERFLAAVSDGKDDEVIEATSTKTLDDRPAVASDAPTRTGGRRRLDTDPSVFVSATKLPSEEAAIDIHVEASTPMTGARAVTDPTLAALTMPPTTAVPFPIQRVLIGLGVGAALALVVGGTAIAVAVSQSKPTPVVTTTSAAAPAKVERDEPSAAPRDDDAPDAEAKAKAATSDEDDDDAPADEKPLSPAERKAAEKKQAAEAKKAAAEKKAAEKKQAAEAKKAVAEKKAAERKAAEEERKQALAAKKQADAEKKLAARKADDEKKAAAAKSDDKKVVKKTDDKKTEDKKSDEKKTDEKKVAEKKADASENKVETPPEEKKRGGFVRVRTEGE